MNQPNKRELRLLAQARSNLQRHAALTPALVIEGEKSGVVGFTEFGPGEIGRRALRGAGRQLAVTRPWRVSLLVDTWVKMQEPDEPLGDYRTGDLARDPQAEQGLLLASETRDGLRRVVFQRYEVEGEKYSFEPPMVWPDSDVGEHAIISEFWTGVGQGATR